MCRQQELWGWMLISLGVGLLLASFVTSGFVRCCIGLGAVSIGVLIMQKK